MDKCKGMEREISIKELFWSCMFGWRKIICLGIVFGLLITVFQYIRDTGKAQENPEEEFSLEEELKESEKAEIENIRILRREVNNYREYMNKSTLMKIDPYNEEIIELQYKVQSDYVMNYTKDIVQDYTLDVASMYNRYISGGEFRKELIKRAELNITSKDLKELIGVSRDSNMIYVIIAYPEMQKKAAIIETVKTLLSMKETEVQDIGSHKLMFLGEEQYTMVNDSLIEKKNTILTRIATLNVQINQLENSLTEQQKNVLDKDEETEEEEFVQPVIRKKYLVLGVFIGILLAGIWIVCKVLFAAKLQNSEEIRSIYGECLFGEVRVINKKKKFLSIIDEKLLSLKNRRQKKLSSEQQMDVVCTNVAISCKRQKIDSIYITGSEYENLDKSLLKLLKENLQKQGIQVKAGENMCYNDISMKQGEEIGNILLVEQIEKSIYDEIFNEIQLMKDQNMKVLGIIVFS